MDVWFCVWVLKSALEKGKPDIFNSDQGSQFTSNEFIQTLIDANVQISMDGKWRYIDNIYIERLRRTVKYEDIHIHDYKTPNDVFRGLSLYIPKYNTVRLHSAIWYKAPDDVYYA